MPIPHVYDPSSQQWRDGYEDLPVSPVDGSVILLVPRRIVRVLPWINYDDFIRTEFRAYLSAKHHVARQARGKGTHEPGQLDAQDKHQVVTITRGDISVVERYVKAREAVERGPSST